MRSVPSWDLYTCWNKRCNLHKWKVYQVEIYMLKQTVKLAQMKSVPSWDLHVETSGATCTNEKCTKLRFTCWNKRCNLHKWEMYQVEIYMLKQTVKLAQMKSVPSWDLHVETNRAMFTNEKCTKLIFTCWNKRCNVHKWEVYQVEIYMLKQTVQCAQRGSVPSWDLHVETNGATCTNEKCTNLRFTLLNQTVQLEQMRSVPSWDLYTCWNKRCNLHKWDVYQVAIYMLKQTVKLAQMKSVPSWDLHVETNRAMFTNEKCTKLIFTCWNKRCNVHKWEVYQVEIYIHVETNVATCTNEKCTKFRFTCWNKRCNLHKWEVYQAEIYMLKQTVQCSQMRSVPSWDLHVETNGETCTNEKCTNLRFTCWNKQCNVHKWEVYQVEIYMLK